jgi:hypothetical protein
MKRFHVFTTLILVIFCNAASPSIAADYLTCNVEHVFERVSNGVSNIVTKENETLSTRVVVARLGGISSITISSNKPGVEKSYSNSICKDDKVYSSFMSSWKRNLKNKGSGCDSSLKATQDYYDGFIYIDSGYLSSFKEFHSLRINRVTGTYLETVNITPSHYVGDFLRHVKKGSCENSSKKF